MPCLTAVLDKGVSNHCVILPKTKQGLLILLIPTQVSIYEPLLTHYLGENGQKIFDIETK
jgi:hypothetical protein